jgi:hypothetical protein
MSLVNAQVKIKVEWGDARCVHPMYVAEEKAYYLVGADGQVPDESIAEPFIINRDAKGKERWAEMAVRAKEAGYFFQQQPNIKILRHDTVKNDLTVFFPKKSIKPQVTITKIAPKPTVAKIANPPIATKPPTKIIPEEALMEDDSIPVEE